MIVQSNFVDRIFIHRGSRLRKKVAKKKKSLMKKFDNEKYSCTLFFTFNCVFFRIITELLFTVKYHFYIKVPSLCFTLEQRTCARAIYFDVRDFDRIMCFEWHFERENRPGYAGQRWVSRRPGRATSLRLLARSRSHCSGQWLRFFSPRECRWRQTGFSYLSFTLSRRTVTRTQRTFAHVFFSLKHINDKTRTHAISSGRALFIL